MAGAEALTKSPRVDRTTRGGLIEGCYLPAAPPGAKQYSRPAPPVDTRFGWLQPRLACTEFHDAFATAKPIVMPHLHRRPGGAG